MFAAASLTEAFTEIGEAFSADGAGGGSDVRFNFAGSSALATQIIEGAPADVYASADLANMQRVVDAGATADEPVVFATNRAEIVVEAGNPLGIAGLEDLDDRDDDGAGRTDPPVVVLCAPEVPCGAYAAEILAAAGVTVTPASLEENVRAVVTKVALGEADAGVVYRTDVAAAMAAGSAVDGVPIDEAVDVLAEYPIAVVNEAGSAEPGLARAFVEFVRGPEGRAILASYGFRAP